MRTLLIALFALLCAPASAEAASLVNENGVLTFTASPGTEDAVRLRDVPGTAGAVLVATRAPQVLRGCTPSLPGSGEYRCDAVRSVEIDAGDGDDDVRTLGLAVAVTITSGAGQDVIFGGRPGDRLDGGPGDDFFLVPFGVVVIGGSGLDRAYYGNDAPRVRLALSLDQGDLRSVEDVAVGYDLRSVVLTGSDRGNELSGTRGDDTIVGGGGADAVAGWAGDDRLELRDGEPDRADCGQGQDTVLADQFDRIGASCEVVRVRRLANRADDRPPTVRWGALTRLRVQRISTLKVTAGDDQRVTRVRFLAGARIVCTDREAPFTCDYRPRRRDGRRVTLIAIAEDGAGQTTSAIQVAKVRVRTP
jgi:hypothetical protein